MVKVNKASELLAKMREKVGLPEQKPIVKALIKKDEEVPEPEYVWGYIRVISKGCYVAGGQSEGGRYLVSDYRNADYIKIVKDTDIFDGIRDYEFDEWADPDLGKDDFMFVEAEIRLIE